MSTVLVASAVKSNDFVTKDVTTSGNVAGDGHGPAVVVGNQVVGSPCTRDAALVDDTLLGNLEELKLGLVNGGTVAVAAGEVVDHGTVVALGPLSPLQLNITTGGNGSRQLRVLSTLVADDVGVRVAGSVDEAQVGGFLGPANNGRGIGAVGVLVDEVSVVVLSIGNDSLDITVASDHGRRGKSKTGSSSDRHFVGLAGISNAQRS